MAIERRASKRVKKSIALRAPSFGLRDQHSLNIGLGGFLIESNKFYAINQILDIELEIPDKEPVYCKARVVWTYPRRSRAYTYKIGLEFLDLSPEDRKKLKGVVSGS